MAAKPVIKVNSNPNPTPAKSMRGPVDSGKYSWSANEWNSKEGTGPYGQPTYNSKAPINPIKVNSNPNTTPARTSPSLSQGGRLGGAHAGGHGISELEMAQGKTPSKLGGLGALGARIARATEGEVPLP